MIKEGEKVRIKSGVAYIPVSQSSLGLTFSKGLGYVTEIFYSFPPVLAYLRSYQQMVDLRDLLIVIPYTLSHTGTCTHNLFSTFTTK